MWLHRVRRTGGQMKNFLLLDRYAEENCGALRFD